MVTTTAPPARRRWLMPLLVLAALAAAMFTAPTVAAQQTDDSNYGFAEACDQLQSGLNGVGIPGLPSLGDVLGTGCDLGNVATHPGDAAGVVRDKAWDSTFGKAVDSLIKGLGEILILSLTFWVQLPNSTLANSQNLFTEIHDYTFWLQFWTLVASIIYCGLRYALARTASDAAEHANEGARMLGRTMFASVGFSTVLITATTASDEFANWMIDEATDGNARGLAEAMLYTSSLQAFSPGLMLFIAGAGIICALAQVFFAVLRQGMLIIVVGVLPIAAASSGFDTGSAFYRRLLTWTLAFLLWKPAAAIVYMIAFVTVGKSESLIDHGSLPADSATAQRILVGVVLLCSAAAVLPALMRLASPVALAASRAGSGGGLSSGLLGAMVLRGRVPTGAASSRGGGRVPVGPNRSGGGGASAGARMPSGAGMGTGMGTWRAPRATAPSRPAPTSGSGRAGGGGRAGAVARAGKGTPAGAAAAAGLVVASAVGAGRRAVHTQAEAAASPQGSPRTSGPTGSGRGAVPR